MKPFFLHYFPTRRHLLIFGLLLAALLGYLVTVPFLSIGNNLFDLFRYAGGVIFENASRGDYDYEHLRPAAYNYYKMSPLFAVIPLSLLAQIPDIPAGIFWQILGMFLYLAGVIWFFSTLPLAPQKPTVLASALFTFLVFFDLNINGVYLQSNAIIAGGTLLGLAFYFQKRFFLAGLALAVVTNIKLLPIIPALLLMTGLKPRFILSFFGCLAMTYLAPSLFFGWHGNLEFHKSLFRILSMDGNYKYGNEEVHFHYGIRAFIQSNWGIVPGTAFNFIPFLFGAVGGMAFFLK